MPGYVPFVQKYRPQKFSDLIGQEQVVSLLQSAFRQGSIAPAYLFSGPHGVGKTSAARIFAKLINCQSPRGLEPCCTCESCLQISQGRSIDIIEIDAASNRRIDEVRQLRENVKFAPVSCRYKVYIIDEVHMLTLEAFNALLKTLEEPPSHVRFILATTHPHKLPPTILSRCQKVDFIRASKEAIRHYVETIIEKESLELEPQVIEFIVSRANGCMRDAAALLEQISVLAKSSEISWEELVSILSYQGSHLVQEIIEAVVKKDVVSIVKIVNRIIEEGVDLATFLSELEQVLRAGLLAVESVPEELWQIDEDVKKLVIYLKDNISEAEIFYITQVLIKMKSWVRTGILDRLALELGFIKMARRDYFRPVREVVKEVGLETLGGVRREKDSVGSRKREVFSQPRSRTNLASTEIPEFWRRVIAELVKGKNMLLAHILQDVGKVGLNDDVLELVFNQRFSYESMKDEKNISVLKDIVKRLLGKDVRFRFSVKSRSPVEERDLVLEEKLDIVLKTFGGKVIEKGKIKY